MHGTEEEHGAQPDPGSNDIMHAPPDPIAAVTHADPYPYYAGLLAKAPLYYDASLRLWIASGAATVAAVLASDLCRVRPAREHVPSAIAGTSAGEVFARFVRMNEGADHGPLKQAIAETLASVSTDGIADSARRWAHALLASQADTDDAGWVDAFAFDLPAHVVASLLGVPPALLPETAEAVGAFVRCLSPLSTPQELTRASIAATALRTLFSRLLDAHRSGPTQGRAHGLLAALSEAAERVGQIPPGPLVANAIGLLSQTYEATAGLIGNSLVAIGRRADWLDDAARDRPSSGDRVERVLLYDPPIQNTRRFVAEDGVVAGHPMKAGDAILVLLAAANRDPAIDVGLTDGAMSVEVAGARPRSWSFGHSRHACPGERWAKTIATVAVEALVARGLDCARLAGSVGYRRSVNARIPVFGSRKGREQDGLRLNTALEKGLP